MNQMQIDFGSGLTDPPRPTGAELRDAALSQVSANAGDDKWESVLNAFNRMSQETFIGEDIRAACEASGVVAHTPKFWGAVVNVLVRKGLIEPTGEYR